MENLSIDFCGVSFKNPVIVAPGPITTSVKTIETLVELGVGGVVIKSISTTQPVKPNRRHLLSDEICLYSTGVLSGEVIDIDLGINLIDRIKNSNIIVIASVLGDSKSMESWLSPIKRINETYADIIELNLRYSFPSPRAYPLPSENFNKLFLEELIENFQNNLKYTFELCKLATEFSDKPIIVKLFPDYMTIAFAIQCEKGGANGVTLINSLNTIAPPRLPDGLPPYPFINGQSYSMCSGSILRPLMYKYVYEAKRTTNLEISACGGISKAEHIVKAIMLGASVCQIGTAFMIKGKEHVKQVISELGEITKGYDLKDLKGKGLVHIIPSEQRDFLECHAFIKNKELCKKCSECPVQAILCGAINERAKCAPPVIDKSRCSGCGLCAQVCKMNNVLIIKSL